MVKTPILQKRTRRKRRRRRCSITFPDILKSREPMEAMRLGTTSGMIRHFSMFRNSLPG
jgi:hypothetical protein